MDNAIMAALQKAYQLIKTGKQDEARAILIPIVRTNQDISEAWYLLGFAVTDPEKRLYAFQQVLRIDPANQSAQTQIAKLLAAKSAASPFTVMPDISTPTASQSAVQPVRPAGPPQTTPPPAAKKQVRKKGLSPVLLALTGVVILLVCFAGGAAWLLLGNGLPAAGLPLFAQPSATPEPSATASPSPSPSPSPTPLYVPVFKGTGCPFTVPLGTRVKCGVVKVPQNHHKDFETTIELPVVIYQSKKPDADLVMYLQGGPGSESIDWSQYFFDDYVTPILEDHDMLFFDPRGTGRSKPALDCPELNKSFIDSYFQNRSPDEAFKDFLTAWSKCHDRFSSEGIDPSMFNTDESAADVHDIAVSLGYKQVNLLGISYGTRLGLTVMRDYPEIVRSTVLDSVVPVEAKMFNQRGVNVQYALKQVFADCAKSPKCNGAYPDLGNIFNSLIERFDQEPATIKTQDPYTGFTFDVKANGVDMLSAVVWGLHNSELVPVIPKAIYDIQNGDYTFLSFALGVPGGTFDSTGMGTYFATTCPEQVYVSSPQELDSDLNVTPLIKKFSMAGLFGSSQNVFDLCKAWGAKKSDPSDVQPVKSSVPTLVISGQYDPTTPVTDGEMVSNDLPNDYFYVIPGMGHGATIGNKCSLAIMMAFLKDPTKAPDSSCLQRDSFEFFLPYIGTPPVPLEPAADHALRIHGLVPVGWKRSLSDYSSDYTRRAYLFDPTLLQIGAFNWPKATLLNAMRSGFESSGLETSPNKIATRSANGLTWTVYESKYNGEPVIFGLAEVSNFRTLIVAMIVSAPERDGFYNGLFLPVMDALVSD